MYTLDKDIDTGETMCLSTETFPVHTDLFEQWRVREAVRCVGVGGECSARLGHAAPLPSLSRVLAGREVENPNSCRSREPACLSESTA